LGSVPLVAALVALLLLALSGSRVHAGDPKTAPERLRVAVVQTALATSFQGNRDRIVAGVASAAAQGARVAVFPEAALSGRGADRRSVEEAVEAIRRAAIQHRIYILFGGYSHAPSLNKGANWMLAIGPDGTDLLHYEKLYDYRRSAMPGVFFIDGIPVSTVICADRWLRGVEEIPIQQGARISFELSCNFAVEWVEPLQWYWYVSRALRNDVWVVFANVGNPAAGAASPDDSPKPRHGHSAIIAPDGKVASAASESATVIVADIDLAHATRAEAMQRSQHPVLQPFWAAGLKLQQGEAIEAPPLTPVESPEIDLTVAIAQVTGNLAAMKTKIREARAKNADIVIFPARAIEAEALGPLSLAARENHITVVFGAEYSGTAAAGSRHPGGEPIGGRTNAAFVIGPEGTLLTRYDQLSAMAPFAAGTDPGAMWFRVKGVPAVVTIGRDALWTEIPELAAVAGAQLHVHLDHDPARSGDAQLRRLQVWVNAATFLNFTAAANVIGSAIWDDIRGREEIRAELNGEPRPDSGPVEVYSPWSANLVVQAGTGAELITATRRVARVNVHYPRQTSNFNPQMDAWYRFGAAIIRPRPE
jgi:deaminated glutathione amidase